MSGRQKFSDLEARMSPARRARIARLAEKLEHGVPQTPAEKQKESAASDRRDPEPAQTRAARSGAAG
jgi:hypothetical protein